MKRSAAVVFSLLAVALPALAESFLSVSDVHFNPFSDPGTATSRGYTAWHLPNVTLPWVRQYSFDENYDTATLQRLAAKIDSDESTRTEYFTHMSSGAPKSTAGALAKWQGYWCGFTAMRAKTFTSCYCAQ